MTDTASGRRTIVNLPNILTVSRILATPLFLAMLFSEGAHWRVSGAEGQTNEPSVIAPIGPSPLLQWTQRRSSANAMHPTKALRGA